MKKPQYHLFLCNSFRMNGDPQGCCHKQGSADLLQYLQTEVTDRGLDAMVSTTSCLNVCEKGPVLVVYPQQWWYHEVTEAKLDGILDALEQDESVPALRLC